MNHGNLIYVQKLGQDSSLINRLKVLLNFYDYDSMVLVSVVTNSLISKNYNESYSGIILSLLENDF